MYQVGNTGRGAGRKNRLRSWLASYILEDISFHPFFLSSRSSLNSTIVCREQMISNILAKLCVKDLKLGVYYIDSAQLWKYIQYIRLTRWIWAAAIPPSTFEPIDNDPRDLTNDKKKTIIPRIICIKQTRIEISLFFCSPLSISLVVYCTIHSPVCVIMYTSAYCVYVCVCHRVWASENPGLEYNNLLSSLDGKNGEESDQLLIRCYL